MFEIGEKVYVTDPDEGDICEGKIVKLSEIKPCALVQYRTMDSEKRRWVSFEELEETRCILYETASWF